jgi:hypothetical protein
MFPISFAESQSVLTTACDSLIALRGFVLAVYPHLIISLPLPVDLPLREIDPVNIVEPSASSQTSLLHTSVHTATVSRQSPLSSPPSSKPPPYHSRLANPTLLCTTPAIGVSPLPSSRTRASCHYISFLPEPAPREPTGTKSSLSSRRLSAHTNTLRS